MPGTYTMTNKQHAPGGVTLKDEDGQDLVTLPDGFTVSFLSADPSIADFVVGPDGMNGDTTSGKVGTTTIVASVTWPDGVQKSDTITVNVINSAPGVPNFTLGEPIEE